MTQNGKSTISEVAGQVLSTPIEFSYTWESFDDVNSAKTSGEWPNDADVLKMVNATRQRNAMSAARATAQKSELERIQNTREYKVAQIVAAMVKAGVDKTTAESIAESQVPA